jgi:hypothetical protein
MRLREPVSLKHRPSRSNSGSRSPSMFGAMLRRIWALPMSTSEGRFAREIVARREGANTGEVSKKRRQ